MMEMTRSQILGELFEIFVLKLVLMSGYKPIDITDIDQDRIRHNRRRFIEFKGRGEFHQIDVPVDLIFKPNFIYPIRLLGEVKYHQKPIEKHFIREEIGKMKDIQENYIVNDLLTREMRRKRRLEIFAFFSSSGFTEESERLAYAHGIKTISFENNYCIRKIIDFIRAFSLDISLLTEEEQKRKLDEVYDTLILGQHRDLDFPFHLLNTGHFAKFPASIKTSIIGTTSTGLTIHFLSFDEFPVQLFNESDFVKCKYHSSNGDTWVMTINNCESKFYFSMPEIIKKESFMIDGNAIYPNKEHEFETVSFVKIIDGKQRNLEFIFDSDWFHHLVHHNIK